MTEYGYDDVGIEIEKEAGRDDPRFDNVSIYAKGWLKTGDGERGEERRLRLGLPKKDGYFKENKHGYIPVVRRLKRRYLNEINEKKGDQGLSESLEGQTF